METEQPPIIKTEATPTNGNGNGKDSQILGVSVRAWLALMLVTTVCVMSVLNLTVTEPLYTMAGLGIGFYFGQKNSK